MCVVNARTEHGSRSSLIRPVIFAIRFVSLASLKRSWTVQSQHLTIKVRPRGGIRERKDSSSMGRRSGKARGHRDEPNCGDGRGAEGASPSGAAGPFRGKASETTGRSAPRATMFVLMWHCGRLPRSIWHFGLNIRDREIAKNLTPSKAHRKCWQCSPLRSWLWLPSPAAHDNTENNWPMAPQKSDRHRNQEEIFKKLLNHKSARPLIPPYTILSVARNDETALYTIRQSI